MEPTAAAGGGAGGGLILIVELAIIALVIVSLWKIFVKAGQPGWASIIPIYNLYVLLKIAGKPGWWLILMFVPIVNIVFGIMAIAAFAARFGKGVGYVVGLILLPFIFYPMLAFGDAQYQAAATP